ncbi:MAG: Ldh family oxidoreductase, partial [Anaerolineae bacterium]
ATQRQKGSAGGAQVAQDLLRVGEGPTLDVDDDALGHRLGRAGGDLDFAPLRDRGGGVVAEGIVDVEGRPLTDPQQILSDLGTASAAFLPLGGAGEELAGYKGYGLGTIVEILSASLCGGVFMKDLLGFAPDGSRRPYMLGHFFLAIDVEHFLPLELSRRITGQIMRELKASRLAPGQDHIYVAGEKEHLAQQRVQKNGVAVNPGLRAELQLMRDELDIEGYDDYF